MSRRVPEVGRPTKRSQRLHLVDTSNGKHAPEPSSPTPLTAGAAVPPPAAPPPAGDRFPHVRPDALNIASLQGGGSRKTLASLSDQLVGIIADSINQVREIAVICRAKGDSFNEVAAHRVAGMLAFKGIELTHGRRLTMDVNVRSQEDLIPWDAFPRRHKPCWRPP